MKWCVLFVLGFLSFAVATDVDECDSISIADISARTTLTPCKRPPCKLKKGTSPTVELKFKTNGEVKSVINHVSADVLGVALPFVGVDGKSVCDKIYEADNPEVKAPCPLKANTEYIYRDSFKVEKYYPNISTRIHWSLSNGRQGKDITCFEVAARIVN